MMDGGHWKARIRDALPARIQIPAKYWYLRASSMLEAEMALLPFLAGSGDLALDIGANYGAYTYALARRGVRVALFEPNPGIVAALAAWANARSGISVHGVALSDGPGHADLLIPCDAAGVEHDSSASIGLSSDGLGRRVRVATATLDSFGYRDAALIKIDVEGHEASVIAGARETIASGHPALIVEIEQRHIDRPVGDALAEVLSLGYRGFFLRDGALVGVDRFDPAVHQSAAAFATRGAAYHNNFLFLAEHRLARGDYAALFVRFAAT
jgi:FkbM family methyltransferase